MRAVIQRVNMAKVTVEDKTVGEIQSGILVLLGVCRDDTEKDVDYMVEKVINLRIFTDSQDKMNLSLLDVSGQMLVVSQFTLYGDCKKGRRPSYDLAASPEKAKKLYENFLEKAKKSGVIVQSGIFQAHMEVTLENNGPVTLIVESK